MMLPIHSFTQHSIYYRCFVSFAEETDAGRLQTMYQKARQDANWVLQKVSLVMTGSLPCHASFLLHKQTLGQDEARLCLETAGTRPLVSCLWPALLNLL